MKEEWEVVAEIPDETLREILIEEGIPEEDIDKEVEKLRKNATITIGIRAVLITPEVDALLKSFVSYVKHQNVASVEEVEKVEDALWP